MHLRHNYTWTGANAQPGFIARRSLRWRKAGMPRFVHSAQRPRRRAVRQRWLLLRRALKQAAIQRCRLPIQSSRFDGRARAGAIWPFRESAALFEKKASQLPLKPAFHAIQEKEARTLFVFPAKNILVCGKGHAQGILLPLAGYFSALRCKGFPFLSRKQRARLAVMGPAFAGMLK
jgi:hypothetical protein